MPSRGDKSPSARQPSENCGVSPAAIFQAYYLLEARELITARERLGYFVTGGAIGIPPVPEPTVESNPDSMRVNVGELVFDVLESSITNILATLGLALAAHLLLKGMHLEDAPEYVRRVESRCV